MGDFNVNCIKDFCDLTIHSQQFVNMFLSHYYLKLINIPTRVTKTSENLLDNIYTNDPMSGTNGVLMSDFSDHYSIFSIGQENIVKVIDKFYYKREYTQKKRSHF